MLLYIDPGTGTMLLTVFLGIASAGYFLVRKIWIKLKYTIGGGKKQRQAETIPYLIYSDDKRYWNTFKTLCDEFEKRKLALVYWTSSEDDPALEMDYEYVKCIYAGSVNVAASKLNILDADIVISTTPGLDVYQWKRSKNVKWYVHICHAPGDVSLYRMFGLDYYDAVLTVAGFQGDQIRKIEKLHNVPEKEIQIVGLTYLDEMKKREEQERCNQEEKNSEITVLLAPSWGSNGILSRYGDAMIDGLLATGYHIIIRPHPQSFSSEKENMDRLMAKYPESEGIEWNRDNDNFGVLQRSDIMISDFSGVIFDYAMIFRKPVIYTEEDLDTGQCDAAWLNEPTWIMEALKKMGVPLREDCIGNMKQIIDDSLQSNELKEGIQEVIEDGWANVGGCAASIADYLVDKHKELSV